VPCKAWLWQSTEGREARLARDPAALPKRFDEAVRVLRDGERGPRFAKLVPIKVVKLKGRAALIQEPGQEARAVNVALTVPWHEGLHLVAELEAHPVVQDGGATNWHLQHLPTLREERAKYSNNVLSAATYLRRALLDIAATGPKSVDLEGKEWSYRRDLRSDAPQVLAEGKDERGLWRVREVSDYMPPWVAFCHPKCGLYQDYYLIRWAPPFSDVDYGETETGWEDGAGATWEPDECLPLCCDGLRLAAKRRWLATQLKREGEAAAHYREQRAAKVAAVLAAEQAEADIVEEAEDVEQTGPALKRRKTGEDDPEAIPLWETIVSAGDFKNYVKDAQFLGDFGWQVKGGTIARQLMRVIDACLREKRVEVAWSVARACMRASNEGPLSARTRLATEAACDLAKAKKINLRVLETIIGDLAKSVAAVDSESVVAGACGAAAWVLVHMFPQRKDVGWGWLHMGWSWNAWWDFVARCLQDFKPALAFQILRTSLELMLSQAGPGSAVRELGCWGDDPQRLKELRRRLCKTSGLTGVDLLKELDHLGIDDKREEPPQGPTQVEEKDKEKEKL